MPELPEVQVIVNHLNELVLNKKIKDIEVFLPKILKNQTPDQFINRFKNQEILEIQRHGKYLLFFMDNNDVIAVHLRMEGKFFYLEKEEFVNRAHAHIVFYLQNGYKLVYHDTRQFGTFHVYDKTDYLNSKELQKVNKDPLDKTVDANFFYAQLSKSNKDIKTLLLDQTKISGIGNIYANEILFACQIHPATKASSLKRQDFTNLYTHAKNILATSIEHNGTSIHSFKVDKDKQGSYQSLLQVHGRDKENCFHCPSIIEKIKLNGRGTYFCPRCQKARK
ncbi:DNA-formamidopyrimidine glycosylase [Ureaplasma miroungigenitalium]|uniref:Formamidopyrimidine-DNA glycosylase n=1 Tax=Ureaplasma miroungigenitalium TaxID=1042321 RepID=A0ABT3BMY5_9BACT|nr:DNA-formamidopyrimidine glycosylase [Ureaplasma miroungigenitalium]MCV3728598.1 DNA-formamidopyrimidine glycosylase [Ureaplasma miroungigenitalium]MCV3734395.1 DNA-formamidopyrimidine glycosylase [Ureaplasma miroungigenitalium]